MNRLQWTIGGTGLVITAGIVFGLYRLATTYYDFGAASAELPDAVAAYRKAGLPFVAADIAPPHLDPAHNAAPQIRAAIEALPPQKLEADLQNAAKATAPVPDVLLRPYAKALAALANAPAKVDWARDWDLGPHLEFPELPGLKRLARAASLRAERDALKNDDAAALRDLTLARQVALWAGQEPTLIALFVRIACERLALDGAERCLIAVRSDPARIMRYQAWLRAAPPFPDAGYGLRGEAWLGVSTVRNLDRFPSSEDEKAKVDSANLRREGVPETVHMRGLMARSLQVWTEAAQETNGFRLPPVELGERIDAVEERWYRKKGLSRMLVTMTFPSFKTGGRSVAAFGVRREVEKAFADTLLIHARTGRWPPAVAQKDPMTGEPLKVRLDKRGFRVYGVGQDGQDDGGRTRREAPKGGKKVTWDEVAGFPAVR